jgi:hypothetical protein
MEANLRTITSRHWGVDPSARWPPIEVIHDLNLDALEALI